MSSKIFSFFSGAGFLDYGFEESGFRVVYVNENHVPFIEAYKYARQQLKIEEPEYGFYAGSITDFLKDDPGLADSVRDSRKDGSLVGFIGGPPCPDFSAGGKNRGRHGENGSLSQRYTDLIIQQRPDFFLFENVKGLWKTIKHREFYEDLKRQLKQKGYKLSERLINAIEYGAPQNRERVILIGFLDYRADGDNAAGVSFDWLKHVSFPGRTAFNYDWPHITPFSENGRLSCPNEIPKELTVEYWFRRNDVKNHPNADNWFKPQAGLTRFRTVAEGDVSNKKSYKRLHRWRYSPTAAYGNNEVHLHPYKSRRLSVAEALAIQSLPKDFILPPEMTLSNLFKTVGNGVPFLAAKGLASALKMFLEGNANGGNSSRLRVSNQPALEESGLQKC